MMPYAQPAECQPMGERDLDPVAALEASLQAFPWTRGNFADSLTTGHSCWVLREGSELLGFAILMAVLDEAHLLNLGVAVADQGRGHGARLLRHVMMRARDAGAVRLLLEVRPSNARAVALYEHFGFQRIGVRRDYYPAVSGREDGLVYDRELV